MRELQDAGVVRIAVPEDAPPIGFVARGAPRGFGVTLGRMIARTLGVRAEISARASDRLQGLVDVGGADVAFPAAPLTEEVAREHVATDPYLVGHQRLLVRRGAGITGAADLGGRTVCAYVDPRTAVDVEALAPGADVRPASSITACAAKLARGKVDAVTAQDFVLAWARRQIAASGGPPTVIVGDALNTVGYGARVTGRPGFPQFVREVLEAAQADGRWQAAYRRWIDLPLEEPPAMTLQDAASLWPTEVDP